MRQRIPAQSLSAQGLRPAPQIIPVLLSINCTQQLMRREDLVNPDDNLGFFTSTSNTRDNT
jgi:hypothetical protein